MNILEMAMAAKMGGGGTGPIDPKRLPEGYPYKEGVTIEWDGNTEGLDVVADTYYRVSDAIVSDEQIKVGVMADANGNEQAVTAIAPWDTFVSMGYVTEDVTSVESVVFVRKDGAVFQGVTFNKTGVYFMALVRKFTTEIIHTMAPEFLPAGVGGGVPAVTTSDNGKLLRVVNGAWTAVDLENAEGGSF